MPTLDDPRLRAITTRARSPRTGGAVRVPTPLARLAAGLAVGLAALLATPLAAAAEPPADYRALIGKSIWYAPHAGCLDRLRTRAGDGGEGDAKAARWARRYPEADTALRLRDLVQIDGRWHYRFDWADSAGAGVTPADRVVADTRFQALPTTFFKTCFFLERPQALAGYLKAEHPQALQRYDAPSAAERQREIDAIESRDARAGRSLAR